MNFPERLDKNNEENSFGYIGRIVKEKGIQDVLRACKILKDKSIKFNYLIYGRSFTRKSSLYRHYKEVHHTSIKHLNANKVATSSDREIRPFIK
ncbi:glycosyltransferase [Picrophilus oshimae]|uniref:glycosyltransferase n=1 Tax=Picrophilus oshimae TaxID=46632 RepID=UPI000A07AE75